VAVDALLHFVNQETRQTCFCIAKKTDLKIFLQVKLEGEGFEKNETELLQQEAVVFVIARQLLTTHGQ
jgi:hypothetical protein